MRAFCRSRITEDGEGSQKGGILPACHRGVGSGERDLELEWHSGIPQKPWLGMGILGSDGGDSSTLTSHRRWLQAVRALSTLLSGLCTPTAASLYARIVLHCVGQVHHWVFLLLPSHPLSAGPAAPSSQVSSGDKAVPSRLPPLLPRAGLGLSGCSAGEGRSQQDKKPILTIKQQTAPGEGEYLELL